MSPFTTCLCFLPMKNKEPVPVAFLFPFQSYFSYKSDLGDGTSIVSFMCF